MKTLIVGGKFDNDGGRPSSLINKLADKIPHEAIINGGDCMMLNASLVGTENFDVVLWFPDIDNDRVKLVGRIKTVNPKCLLVSSKSVLEKNYDVLQIVQHGLAAKANLMVEFSRGDKLFNLRLLDPLGNCFCDRTSDLDKFAKALMSRIEELKSFTRVKSTQVSEANGEIKVPSGFLEKIRKDANTFHKIIYGKEPVDRFLGNASFRCTHGFPSFRAGEVVYVTRRDVPKSTLSEKDFIEVYFTGLPEVYYAGNMKPSVDTPIQLLIYKARPYINFMIHSHVYIKNAPFTDTVIPCGAIEEAEEVLQFSTKANHQSVVNLRGHGSLIMSYSVEWLDGFKYYGRPIPELQTEYEEK
jgi:hypothetical protein